METQNITAVPSAIYSPTPVSADQFVDLNEKVGSFTIDYDHTPERMDADAQALRNGYRSGAVNQARLTSWARRRAPSEASCCPTWARAAWSWPAVLARQVGLNLCPPNAAISDPCFAQPLVSFPGIGPELQQHAALTREGMGRVARALHRRHLAQRRRGAPGGPRAHQRRRDRGPR